MTEHLDDLAELYALGSLDDLERLRVERHAQTCEACAQRLQQAEAAVTALAQSQKHYEAPAHLHDRLAASIGDRSEARARRHYWGPMTAAIAAALVLALIPTWVAVDRTRTSIASMQGDEHALARLASTQFNHAVFMDRVTSRPMNAKVLYGRDGSWYYVVIMHPKPDMHVAYEHGGRMEMLGTVAMHGDSGTLYLPVNHKMEMLALLQGGTVIADARLAY